MVMIQMDMDLFEGLFGLFTNKTQWHQEWDTYHRSIVETSSSFDDIIFIILQSDNNNKDKWKKAFSQSVHSLSSYHKQCGQEI